MSGLDGQFVNTRIPRDRMDRPLVLPVKPDKKTPDKRVPYRRTTRFVGAIEDRYNLELHAQRELIWGLGARPDLVALAGAVQANWNETGIGKMDMAGRKGSIADQARDYAQTAAKANAGTARHQFCEALDKGTLDFNRVPADCKGDIEAYFHATRAANMNMVEIETFRVHDEWKVAGTADRIVEINGVHYIADIKTGKIQYDGAVLKMAMQLAMYAHSTPYDIGLDRRVGDPYHVNKSQAIIIHLPAGQSVCKLYWLDIAYGWQACHLTKKVWDIRDGGKTNRLLTEYRNNAIPQQVVIPSVEEYKNMVAIAKSVDELVDLWRSAKFFNRATEDFVQSCTERKQQILSSQMVGLPA